MRDKDKFDLMLDSALSTYADPGPDSGLEKRALARIDAASTPRLRRKWIFWAIALPAAACLLLPITLPKTQPVQSVHTTEPHQPPLPEPVAHGGPPDAPSAVPSLRTRRPARLESQASVQHSANVVPLPKRDVFPSPRPLTPGERSLVEFATQVPMSQRQAILQARMQDEEPLRIAALDIPLLETPNQGKN
jgi:hypothetical protein